MATENSAFSLEHKYWDPAINPPLFGKFHYDFSSFNSCDYALIH